MQTFKQFLSENMLTEMFVIIISKLLKSSEVHIDVEYDSINSLGKRRYVGQVHSIDMFKHQVSILLHNGVEFLWLDIEDVDIPKFYLATEDGVKVIRKK